jgi:peptidoglycan/xylan/chitin deacetylase (PgdA/CDA1 family)
VLKSHNRYRYVPITERRAYEWPNRTRLAVFVVVNVEVFPFGEGMGIPIAPAQAEPDVVNFSYRDWGNRVGFFRLVELFEEFGFPASMFLNSELFEHCPQIISAIRRRGDEIAAHGRTNAERQASFSEAEERKAILDATQTIQRHTGAAPAGWMSPWVAESHSTPDLLQEAGYRYLMEWSADDQPIWLKTRSGRILSIPYPRPTNDLPMMHAYHMNPELYANILIDQFDETLHQSRKMPLSFCLSFHPYLSGHAFRIRQLRRVFQHIQKHADRVWLARTGEIAEHVAGLPVGVVPGSGD